MKSFSIEIRWDAHKDLTVHTQWGRLLVARLARRAIGLLICGGLIFAPSASFNVGDVALNTDKHELPSPTNSRLPLHKHHRREIQSTSRHRLTERAERSSR